MPPGSGGGPAAPHKSRRHHHDGARIEPPAAHYDDHDHQRAAASADTAAFSTPLIFRPKPTTRRSNNNNNNSRNPSLSSSSSFSSITSSSSSNGSLSFSFSNFPDDSPFSTPVRTPLSRFSGVPFSWEQIPGKPKNEEPKFTSSSNLLLPLPPANNSSSFRKTNHKEQVLLIDTSPRWKSSSPASSFDPNESFRKDPFFAALVECSKDEVHLHRNYWKGSSSSSSSKIIPVKSTLSDRLGFISMYSSCKSSCGVSESIVIVPRSSRRSSRTYNLINRRSI